MIRRLCAALAAFVLGCTPAFAPVSESAVAILMHDSTPRCSAFAVGEHELMTSAHCIEDFEAMRIERAGGESDAVDVVHIDDRRDLALLHTKLKFGQFFKVRAPRIGEPVQTIASVYGWRRSYGEVLSRRYGTLRGSTLSIQHGWSGSPVIGVDGFAIGVVARCNGPTIAKQHYCSPDNAKFSVLP